MPKAMPLFSIKYRRNTSPNTKYLVADGHIGLYGDLDDLVEQ